MKLNAVSVASNNIKKTVEFYSILGFEFPEIKDEEGHIESIPNEDSANFFFQAEDGIRDIGVTGVQTSALPISLRGGRPAGQAGSPLPPPPGPPPYGEGPTRGAERGRPPSLEGRIHRDGGLPPLALGGLARP